VIGDVSEGRDVPTPNREGAGITLGTAIAGALGSDFGGAAERGAGPPDGSVPVASADRSFMGVSFSRLG